MHHAPHPLTAAARRAFDWALASAAHPDDGALLEPALLAGLLREAECRAAALLGDQEITFDVLVEQWPGLSELAAPASHRVDTPPAETSPSETPPVLRLVLAAAREKLAPLIAELATEHLLWGLVHSGPETSAWLAARGVTMSTVDDALARWYGATSAEPLDLPNEELAREPGNDRSAIANILPNDAQPLPSATDAMVQGDTRAHTGLGRAPSLDLLRIVDAAGNRAREAIRVLEDYARFALDDRHLTRECKALRHTLVAALGEFAEVDRLGARDALADVGPSATGPSELPRGEVADVLAANAHRAQEALRSLEEYSKLLRPEVARTIEPLRYRCYTLQRALVTTMSAHRRWGEARLCVLLDGCASLAEFERMVAALLAAGVPAFQLRDKRLEDRELLARARALRAQTAAAGALCIVNDRADLAAAADADGVHLGQSDMCVRDARRVLGAGRMIGVSTHSLEQARQAVLDGADYLGVGPMFRSSTKDFAEYPGLDFAREVSHEIKLPMLAIGGVDAANLAEVLAAGVGRVAVSSAIVAAPNPAAAATELLAIVRRAPPLT